LIPRPQIHHRLGEERADIGILRISFPDFAHRIRVRAIERTAVFRLRVCVTMPERFDQRFLHWCCVPGMLPREPELLPRQLRSRRRERAGS
jgi:hypothetical protein